MITRLTKEVPFCKNAHTYSHLSLTANTTINVCGNFITPSSYFNWNRSYNGSNYYYYFGSNSSRKNQGYAILINHTFIYNLDAYSYNSSTWQLGSSPTSYSVGTSINQYCTQIWDYTQSSGYIPSQFCVEIVEMVNYTPNTTPAYKDIALFNRVNDAATLVRGSLYNQVETILIDIDDSYFFTGEKNVIGI